MVELIAVLAVGWVIVLALVVVVVAVVSGLAYRASRAARILEGADLSETAAMNPTGVDVDPNGRAAA